jgi:hypothetical protein
MILLQILKLWQILVNLQNIKLNIPLPFWPIGMNWKLPCVDG